MMGNSAYTGEADEKTGDNYTDKKEQECQDCSGKSTNAVKDLAFGSTGARRKFLKKIQKWSNEEMIPGILEKGKYEIYRWGDFNFDHQSIVIGCKCNDDEDDDAEYGYFTLELRTKQATNDLTDETNNDNDNTDELIILPFTQYIDIDTAKLNYIDKKKWKLEIESIELTIEDLCNLTLQLIAHHGKYSVLFNNCQNFVSAFIFACKQYIGEMKAKAKNENDTFLGQIISQQYKMIRNSSNDITKTSVIGAGIVTAGIGSTVMVANGKAPKNMTNAVAGASAIGIATSSATVSGNASMVAANRSQGNECEKVKIPTK